MKILYVSQYFPPEIGAPSARVSELAKHWATAGHDVTVLTGFPNHPTGKIAPAYRSRFRRLFFRERIDGVDVVRTWLIPLPNRRPWERILNYTSFMVSAAMRGTFLRKPDVVIATSPQLLVGLAGWWISRVKRAPLIFEVRDIWPDAILASGIGRDGTFFAKSLRAISRFLHRRSERIVVVSPAYVEELVDKWGVDRSKIAVIQNGVEVELFAPDASAPRPALLPDGFVVCYIGTIGFAHGLGTLLEAAELLKDRLPDVAFVIVGAGADREKLERAAQVKRLQNVHFLGELERSHIPAIIQASEVCLVLLKRSDVFKTVIPTKMLEFMACGRPIVLGVDGQARAIAEEAAAAIYVEPESPAALAAAVAELHGDAELRERLGRSGRDYITKNLSRERTAADFASLLEEVAHARSVGGRRQGRIPG